jgi:hypothetical protein
MATASTASAVVDIRSVFYRNNSSRSGVGVEFSVFGPSGAATAAL